MPSSTWPLRRAPCRARIGLVEFVVELERGAEVLDRLVELAQLEPGCTTRARTARPAWVCLIRRLNCVTSCTSSSELAGSSNRARSMTGSAARTANARLRAKNIASARAQVPVRLWVGNGVMPVETQPAPGLIPAAFGAVVDRAINRRCRNRPYSCRDASFAYPRQLLHALFYLRHPWRRRYP